MAQTLETPVVPAETVEKFLDDEDLWAIIVWNDDVNTFDHVIKALVEILQHTTARAEQLTMKIHNSGNAVVGIRPKDEAQAAVSRFLARGIQASLDHA